MTSDIEITTDNISTPQTKAKRAINWVQAEHEQLAQSWPAVSERVEWSNNQTGTAFFDAIAVHFAENLKVKIDDRPSDSCRAMWRTLGPDCERFSAIYARIERDPPSGSSPTQWATHAMNLFQEETNKRFRFFTSWEHLRTHPKWDTQLINQTAILPKFDPSVTQPHEEAKSPTSGNQDQAIAPQATQPPLERPIGGKAAKKRRIAAKKEESDELDRGKALEPLVEVSAMRVKAMQESTDVAKELVKVQAAARLDSQAAAQATLEAAQEANRLAKETMLNTRRREDLEIAQAKEEDCPDELSKLILRGLKAEVAARYQ